MRITEKLSTIGSSLVDGAVTLAVASFVILVVLFFVVSL